MAGLLGHAISSHAGEVDAGLHIPAAETHVIGDETPLVWIFTNQTAQPLAFMWEGCCRLNGRLRVRALGEDLATLPPGPSTAHQFPKAARIDPGQPGEFGTLLSDWVRLTGSGRYELRGEYVGILPTQQPQVPSSLTLWKGHTTTPPLEFAVLAVDDYLGQRSAREHKRKLALSLSGPDRFSHSDPTGFELRIQNTSDQDQLLAWPQSARLWLVDDEGARAPGVPHHPGGSTARSITLPPNEAVQLGFTIDPRDLLAAALGHYRLFIELQATDSQPRLPSKPTHVEWEINRTDLSRLLAEAVQRPGVGSRNFPLKLLRTYLEDLPLSAVQGPASSPKIARLLEELARAACLKRISPQPGQVSLLLDLDAAGAYRFQSEVIGTCLTGASGPAAQLAGILDVRRHLGWTVNLVLHPHERTAFGTVVRVARELAHTDLSGPVTALVPHPQTKTPIRFLIQSQPTSANLIVRIRPARDGLQLATARRLPDPERPQLTAVFQPEQLADATFTSLRTPRELAMLLGDGKLPYPRTLVLVGKDVTWEEVTQSCTPLLDHVTQVDLALE